MARLARLSRFVAPLIAVGAVAALLVAGAGYQRRGRAAKEVTVTVARAAALVGEWSATGYVECRTATVSSPQTGRITEILVREGDRVAAGQVLARLDSEAEEAAAGVQAEAIQVAVAQADAARAGLEETARIQADRVGRAEAELLVARARLEHARAALQRSRAVAQPGVGSARAAVEAARAELADLEAGPRPQELTQAEAAVSDAEAAAARTRIERDRQAALFRERAVPRRAVEDADEAMTRADAMVTRARAALELLRKGRRPDELRAARARLQAAHEELRSAEAQVAGLTVEERAVDEMAAGVRTAEAALKEARTARRNLGSLREESRAARARVGQASAGLNQTRATVRQRVVLAPFAGVIGRRLMDPGAVVSPSQPVFSLYEADATWIVAEVDAQDLAPVRVGAEVDVSVPAYPGRVFKAEVARIGSEAVPQTEVRTSARVVRVRVSLDRLPPRQHAIFRPGLEVHVAGEAKLAERAVLTPNDAILADASGSFLWLAAADGAERRRVKTGFVGARDTEILEGLSPGDQVIVTGKEGLEPGTPLRVK
jgi:RND family efflux transporter MFP subunit